MATQKALQKHFAQYFPHLAGVKLRWGRVGLGPSGGVVAGVEVLRTVAYLVGQRLTDQATVPIQGTVTRWNDIWGLLVRNDCLVAGSIVMIERVIYDHVKQKEASTLYLRDVLQSILPPQIPR